MALNVSWLHKSLTYLARDVTIQMAAQNIIRRLLAASVMTSSHGFGRSRNPEGVRLRKQAPGQTTYFAPGGNGMMMSEYGSSGWIDYRWLNGRLVGRLVAGQVQAIHGDQLDRPAAVTDAGQNTVWRAQNSPFDRVVVFSTSAPLNIGFPGQYYDAETGYWNNGFRDYDANTGRDIQSDPIWA